MIKQTAARLMRDLRGNVLAISAAGAFTLVGGAGLGVDTIQWYLWKRQLQQAVDSAALAGAHAMAQGAAHRPAATADLESNAETPVVIEKIANPPAAGAYAGQASAVEVEATTSQALPFSSLFLSSAPRIRARAVAAIVSEGEHCVIGLAGSGVGVSLKGNANVYLGCGVAANSQDSSAVQMVGSSWLEASPISTVGGIDASSSNYPSDTDFQPYGPPQHDPLASRDLKAPSTPSDCTATKFQVKPSDTTQMSPGRYCNGVTLKGEVVMAPGVYIVDGGTFEITSQAKVSGEGVTIVLTGDSPSDIADAKIAGGAGIDLRAPTAMQNPYWNGIVMFQDPRASSSSSEILGGSAFELQGIVYMPAGDLRFAGNSEAKSKCLLLVANRVTFTGSASLDNDCPFDFSVDSAARRIRVVE